MPASSRNLLPFLTAAFLVVNVGACNGDQGKPETGLPRPPSAASTMQGDIDYLKYQPSDRANLSGDYAYGRLIVRLRDFREDAETKKKFENTFVNFFRRWLAPESRSFTVVVKVSFNGAQIAVRPVVTTTFDETDENKAETQFHLGADLTPLVRIDDQSKIEWTYEIRATDKKNVAVVEKIARAVAAGAAAAGSGGAWVVGKLTEQALKQEMKNIDEGISELLSRSVATTGAIQIGMLKDSDMRKGTTLTLKPVAGAATAKIDVEVELVKSILTSAQLTDGTPNLGNADPILILAKKYGPEPQKTLNSYFSDGDMGSRVAQWPQLPANQLFVTSCNAIRAAIVETLNLNQYDAPAVFWALLSVKNPSYIENKSYRATACVDGFVTATWTKLKLTLPPPRDIDPEARKVEFAEMVRVLSRQIVPGLKFGHLIPDDDAALASAGAAMNDYLRDEITIDDNALGLALGFKGVAKLPKQSAIGRLLTLKVARAGCFTANAAENTLRVSMLIGTGADEKANIRRLDAFFAADIPAGTPPPVVGFTVAAAPPEYVKSVVDGRPDKACGEGGIWKPLG